MSEIPNGYYAVPDPNNLDQLTLWRVSDELLEARPAGAQYGPVLYRRNIPAGLSKPEQQRWASNWFETIQRPWRRAVRAAIAANPETAGALYAKTTIRCRDCGRALTDPTSKDAGRGPDCRAQLAALATAPHTTEKTGT